MAEEPRAIPYSRVHTELLLKLKGTELAEVSFAVPIAAEILAFPECDPFYQKHLASWMLATLTKFKTANNLDSVQEPVKEKEAVNIKDITAMFDPLAEELKISLSQEIFDFTKM